MSDFVKFFEARTPAMLELLEQMVSYESPTADKALVDVFGQFMHQILLDCGADIEVFPRETAGDIRLAKWNADAPGKPIMFLTHIDTVWPEGTLTNEVPIKKTEFALHGPGALDMKGGILVSLEAIRGLIERDEFPNRPVWMLMTTDEEVGSIVSRELIHEVAAQAGLVLVVEPAGEAEAVKTARKGIGRYWVTSKGRASHSGNAPEAGINAVIDNAHQAIKLHDMNDLQGGTSVTVTQFHGGFTVNVVPPSSELYADLRFSVSKEGERVHEAIMALQPVVPGAKLEVRGYIDRPPMERNDQMKVTFQQAKKIATELDLPLTESFSGGGSDGNFTAAMGIPTLDGLGPEGSGMHAVHEHVLIRSLHRRAALMAGILRDWQMPE